MVRDVPRIRSPSGGVPSAAVAAAALRLFSAANASTRPEEPGTMPARHFRIKNGINSQDGFYPTLPRQIKVRCTEAQGGSMREELHPFSRSAEAIFFAHRPSLSAIIERFEWSAWMIEHEGYRSIASL